MFWTGEAAGRVPTGSVVALALKASEPTNSKPRPAAAANIFLDINFSLVWFVAFGIVVQYPPTIAQYPIARKAPIHCELLY